MNEVLSKALEVIFERSRTLNHLAKKLFSAAPEGRPTALLTLGCEIIRIKFFDSSRKNADHTSRNRRI